MKRLLLIIILACSAASGVYAKIGEKPSTLEQRYGKPVYDLAQEGDSGRMDRKVYFEQGYVVVVTYVDGVSKQEKYYRVNYTFTGDSIDGWFKANETFSEKKRPTVFAQNIARFSQGFTVDEVEKILKLNHPGKWLPVATKPNEFRSEDQLLAANYHKRDESGEYLSVRVADPAYLPGSKAEKK